MARNVVRALFIVSLLFLWAPSSQAQALSPYRARVLSQKAGGHFKFHIFGLGPTELHLRPTKAGTFGNVTVQNYRGKAILIERGKRTTRKTKEDLVAVGYVNSKGREQLDVTFRTAKKMYRVHLEDGTERGARVERDSLMRKQRCDHGDNHPVTLLFSRLGLTQAVHQADELREFREVEVAIDLDYEAKVLMKERLVPSVVSVVETANLFFERDLGVHLKLININTESTAGDYPSSITTIPSLLDFFFEKRSYLGAADVYHLLVGRRATGAAGMAAVSPGCMESRKPALSHSVSVFGGHPADATIFAHEVAHLLWAAHTEDAGIMSTVTLDDYFSDTTKRAVSYFLSLPQSSCIEKVNLVPRPTPTATPTPKPTGTPEPPPTATPTAVPSVAPPTLQLTLAQDGTLRGTIEVQEIRDGCGLQLHGAGYKRDVWWSPPLLKKTLSTTLTTLTGTVSQRIKRSSPRDRPRVYVGALYKCPGTAVSYSSSVVLNPTMLKKGKVVSSPNWLRHLGRRLVVQ